MAPKVTVLVPVYGGERHVGDAVASVLAQTFRDFELLIVDDCSPDQSVRVVESFADERIRVVRNESNLGQVASLNRGLATARGAYVARLDQDDICLPERLERQVAALDRDPSVALVGTWMEVTDDGGAPIGALRGTIGTYVEFVFRILTDALPIAHPTVMFRREPILELGGYDESVRYAEDKDLWRRLALTRGDARILCEPLVRYRVHEAQQSRTQAEVQGRSDSESLRRFIEALTARPARPLQLLLGLDPVLWQECDSAVAAERIVTDLDDLVSGATATLGLSDGEAEALARRLYLRANTAGRRAWRSGLALQRTIGRPLSRAARRRLGRRDRLIAGAASIAVTALGPALPLLRAAYRRLRPVREWTQLGRPRLRRRRT